MVEKLGANICHDCGVKEGELHKQGCDMEVCLVCFGQAIICFEHCVFPETGAWRPQFLRRTRIPYIQPRCFCPICGELYPPMFSVPDSEWKRYVIPPLQGEAICRSCYEQLRLLFPNGWAGKKPKRLEATIPGLMLP